MKYWFTNESTKPLAIAATVCAVLLVLCCVWFALMPTTKAEPTAKLYPLTVVVIELDRENDIVTCVDGADNFWEFYGCEDWETGDFASFLMNDQGTTSIYDDTIEMIRYAGIFEG